MRGKMFSRLKLSSLASRVTIQVFLAMLIFGVALWFAVFHITGEWIEKTAMDNLRALATARRAAIESQLRDYLNTRNAFLDSHIKVEIEKLLTSDGKERDALQEKLISDMQRKRAAVSHLQLAEIVDMSGEVIAATSPERMGVKLGDSASFTVGKLQPFILEPHNESGKAHIDLSVPLRNAEEKTIGVLVLHFDARELLAITGDYSGLGMTGENVLGVRREDSIYFIAPLRFQTNAGEVEPAAAAGKRAEPMIHATAGQSGTIRGLDYRNVPVIAAYCPISINGWGLVVKQDQKEAFAEVGHLHRLLLVSAGILLLAALVITLPLVRSFTRPLRELEAATQRVAGGDLNAAVTIDRMDEVGRLSESFNTMVHRLRNAHEDLERRNQELASFAYVVSHDLKAPLRGIASLSKWLAEDLGNVLEGEQKKQLDLLGNRVRRMEALISDILEYSRVGRLRHSPVTVNVGKLLTHIIDTVNPPDNMLVTVVPPMPTLEADAIRLGQVFQNLIQNAIQHHPGPNGEVVVSSSDGGDFWEFSVSDNGDGIEPRHHERIFQMFQTLGRGNDEESTGIGLALVKKIVEENGGTVRLVSSGMPGQGATFTFTWSKKKKGT